MKTVPGTTDDQGELWLRCPYCGDSPNSPHRAHFSVNLLTRKYFCYRCSEGGQMSKRELGQLLDDYDVTFQFPTLEPDNMVEFLLSQRIYGPGCRRKSGLERWHVYHEEHGLFDLFESRDQKGQVVGVHLRSQEPKASFTWGTRALGYAGPRLPYGSVTLRIVEGPYDVVEENDVCIFGLPAPKLLQMLRGYPLILCPDGDIWSRPKLARQYLLQFIRANLLVTGVEILPEGKDPDEVPPEDRELVSFPSVKKRYGGTTNVPRYATSRTYHRGGARGVW